MSTNEKTNPIVFFFEKSWLLMVAAILFGTLLASLNYAWSPIIKDQEVKKFNKLAGGLLADAVNFEPAIESLPVDIGKGKFYNVEVKKGIDANGAVVGWAFVCEGSGFADKIKLVIATDATFETLAGFGVLGSNETPGFGDKINPTGKGEFSYQFIGTPVTDLELVKVGNAEEMDEKIVAITGATVTSDAVVKIFNTFLIPVQEALQKQGLLQ